MLQKQQYGNTIKCPYGNVFIKYRKSGLEIEDQQMDILGGKNKKLLENFYSSQSL